MKIRKIGHCCLVIDEGGLRIMTDPGGWTTDQVKERDLDVVLITHEHADHLHVDSLKEVLKNNPGAKVFTNTGVGKILDEAGVAFELLEDGQSTEVEGVKFSGHGNDHATIYGDYGLVQNTGFMINKLFYPGDSFFNPGLPVKILALPIAAPWMKVSEAFDYAKEIKPKVAFPVHDGYVAIYDFVYKMATNFLDEAGIKFTTLKAGQEFEADED